MNEPCNTNKIVILAPNEIRKRVTIHDTQPTNMRFVVHIRGYYLYANKKNGKRIRVELNAKPPSEEEYAFACEVPASNVYTTGKLDWAQQQGLTVYVMTPQPELREEDAWWTELLPKEQILLGPPHEPYDELAHLRPWFKLLEILGVSLEGIEQAGEATDRIRDRVIFGNQIGG